MKLDTSITNECVRILYGRAVASITTAMVVSAVVVYIFKDQISPSFLFGWFGFMTAISLTRYWMVFDYNKNKQKTSNHEQYEKRYFLATGMTGLGWAIFVANALYLPSHEHHIYALLFLTALVALSVPVFSSSIKTMYFYIAPSLVISVPVLLFQGGDMTALGVAMIVFSIIVIRSGTDSYHTLINTLILRYDTQKQAEKLKQAEQGKSEAEKRLEEVFRVAPEAIITFDNDLNIILFNKTAEQTFGYQQSEILGKHVNTLIPQPLWQEHEKLVRDFSNSEVTSLTKREGYEIVGVKKNGETFPIAASVSKVETPSGKLFIVMINDITARVRAEESLHLSQQRLILHREQSPMGIIEWNTDFEVVAWNPAAEKIFGYSREDVMGQVILDRIVTDSAQIVVEDAWKALIENIGGDHTINENLTKDGQVILCEWNNTSLADENGNVIGVTSIVSDISERHKIEESLRISQQRLLLHREQSPVGIVEWNTNFEVADWNPAAEKIFGYTKDEVIGQHILGRILPESAQSAVNEVWGELQANKGGSYSINENITKDGRTILCEWHNTPLIDGDGNVIGVNAIVDDITERQRQEESTRQTQKMDAIGNLTGGIAHDFNNMLGVILGFSELLKHSLDGTDPNQIKYCNEVLNAGERAKKLTSNLLEFSRIAPSSAESININKLLDGMHHMLARTLTPRINLIFEQEDNLWPVWLDKARLEDAILNMSINAMHAMPDGGKLRLSTKASHLTKAKATKLGLKMGDYVILSITDTGSGIDLEVQEKIFDPFFTTKGTEGTGLGLSQVYGFVQQAGGDVKVSSKIGKGTTLELYFPRHIKDEADKLSLTIEDTEELPSGQGTILVVDDEASLLKLNGIILSASGYQTLLAHDAKQALELLESNNVDLMLCDAIMPDMDGYQLAVEVKKLYPEVKVQMISGYSDESNKTMANSKLHKERLHKPITGDTLLQRVTELLDETE